MTSGKRAAVSVENFEINFFRYIFCIWGNVYGMSVYENNGEHIKTTWFLDDGYNAPSLSSLAMPNDGARVRQSSSVIESNLRLCSSCKVATTAHHVEKSVGNHDENNGLTKNE